MTRSIYPVLARQTTLPFYLAGIGISDPEYHAVRENGLTSHQFLFTEKGKGVLKIGGQTYAQQRGNAFYLAPKTAHEYYPSDNEWCTRWLVFRGKYADQLMLEMGFSSFNKTNELDMPRSISMFNRLYSCAENPINQGENASALLYEIIMAMRTAMLSGDKSTTDLGDITSRAIMYIEQNYANDIQVEQLAQLSGVSVQHFCRVFKMRTSMRPLEYIANRRIAAAKSLLINTLLEIAEIGRQVGYPDRNYFSIVFRRIEGISPRDYRRAKGSAML